MAKICFVISPIGEDGSEVRQLADDLFDIVISPVLRAHGFDVVRADKIARSGTIGDDIVDLIQNATLCVIDLTGHNANVYYECGRRHETGKPFIQLMNKGERLPFDLAGIRTIFYDLSSPRSALAASQEIERFLDEFERSGFSNESSGVSLSTLSAAVDRIDRKLESMRVGAHSQTLATLNARGTGGIQRLLGNPVTSFYEAVRNGDIDQISAIFPRLRTINSQSQEFVIAANILASNGLEEGAHGLESVLDSLQLAPHWKIAIGGLRRYYELRDAPAELLALREVQMAAMIDDAEHLPDAKDRAFIANQLGIIAETAGQSERSVRYTQRAIDLDPAEIAYHANLAISLEQYDLKAAEVEVDRYMSMPAALTSSFALGEAVDVFRAVGRVGDADRVIAILQGVDPGAANMKAMEGE